MQNITYKLTQKYRHNYINCSL